MKSKHVFAAIFIVLTTYSFCVIEPALNQKPGEETEIATHVIWDDILRDNVSLNGEVNYEGIARQNIKLKNYLRLLSTSNPNGLNWKKEDVLAFWINAYNAFTIKLIIDNYPVKSIKDIKSPWKQKFFKINGVDWNLNDIEHKVLRTMGEPRIHFAIVCASYSCPSLRKEAYTANKLEVQLNDQAKLFINDPNRNKVGADKLELSKIFKWFKSDFTVNGSLQDFINNYSNVKVSSEADIDYLDYNWSLNK